MAIWLGAILWHLFAVGPYGPGAFRAADILLSQINLYFFAGLALSWAQHLDKIASFTLAGAMVAAALFCLA